MLLLMMVVVGVFYYTPLAMNTYSPLPAMLSPWSDRVQVSGRIIYENGTPAVGVEVKLFATDDLITDIVLTDVDGYFISTEFFDTGQIITISINNVRLWLLDEPFIDYDAVESQGPFWLGTFMIR